MNKNSKGSTAKRTPSKNRITGESSTKRRYKKLAWDEQFKRLDIAFNSGSFTMKTVSINLRIDRANICRYIAKRRKENRIYLVKYGICPITKTNGVGFYTSNLELFNMLKTLDHGK